MSKIKCTYGHIVSCALDIQHYCANTDCEECYFYSELPNGHVKCIALGEPHEWEIDKMQRREDGMTNRQAITVLKKIITVADKSSSGIKEIDGTDEEAIQVAIKALEQAPCDDAISRQAVLDIDFHRIIHTTAKPSEMIRQKVKALPSVNPQEPKTGHWIDRSEGGRIKYPWMESNECSKCGENGSAAWNYCPNCGARMVEPQESEDKE